MASPFDSNVPNRSIVMYLEPILNSFYQTYQNIITLSAVPQGPIQSMVSPFNPPKLSEFQQVSPFSRGGFNCVYVLWRYPTGSSSRSGKTTDNFMTADDIPSVFSYLTANGYTIDTSLTKMLAQSRIDVGGPSTSRLSGDRKMVCMFSWNG